MSAYPTKESIYRFKLQASEDVEQGAKLLALFLDPSIDGQTPLMAAAQYGHTDIVRFLLDKGADAHAKDAYGQTAVDTAAKHGHKLAVELLARRRGTVPA